MKRLGDAAGNAGERVGVAAERHCIPDRVLVAGRLERAHDCRRHRALARDFERLPDADLLDQLAEVVAEARCDFPADRPGICAMARQLRREHRRLGAGDGVGVVVADRSGAPGGRERVSLSSEASQATALTRMAAPLPQLP